LPDSICIACAGGISFTTSPPWKRSSAFCPSSIHIPGSARRPIRASAIKAEIRKTLARVCGTIGCPNTSRVDKGSEFISRDLDLWAYTNPVTLDFSRPGKPTDNDFIEAFNSKQRSECL
tara:strand:+ start:653 stop:1009 length:357 start_codon:yes stop_codon:yes gene_type:complete